MKAEILSIGTELLLGDIVNTNAQFLASELARAGVQVYYHIVVGDNPVRLREQLAESFSRSDVVITTGGLGPTYDDLTKERETEYFGREMREDPAEIQKLEGHFQRFGTAMTQNNRKQALLPEGARFLPNENGTASGIWLEGEGKLAILLPGPPREMQPMFLEHVLPKLQEATGQVIHSSTVHLFGIGESAVEQQLHERMEHLQNPTLAPYAKTGEVRLRITAMAEDEAAAEALIAPVRDEVIGMFGDKVYGIDVGNLETALVRELGKRGLRVATAESCTGGYISQRITSVSGSSGVFDCGITAYANRIKMEVLGVSEGSLRDHGAVSHQVALQMARGVRKLSGANIGVATTGVAGPGGGTPEKPVGLVYIGVSTKDFEEVFEMRHNRGGTNIREDVRFRASSQALYMALTAAKKL